MDEKRKITMVLADDEMLVRKGLLARLPVAEFGIEITGVAENGQQALELCRKIQPDILFCDIRMPHIDGLEVASTLRDEFPDLRVIFFSGVQDFGYARSALEIQADGYILKPIHMDEVRRVLGKVVRQIALQEESRSQFEHLRALLNENKDALRDKFLNSLVEGSYLDENEICHRMAWYDLHIPTTNLTCAVLEPDDGVSGASEEQHQMAVLSVLNIISEVLGNSHTGVGFLRGERQIVMILGETEEAPVSAVCEDVVSCIDRYLQRSVSVGIGGRVERITALPASLAQAQAALQYRVNVGERAIISIDDVHAIKSQSSEGMDTGWIYETIRLFDSKIFLAVRQNSRQLLMQTLEEIFAYVRDSGLPLICARALCQELMGMAGRLLFDQSNSAPLGRWTIWASGIAAADDLESLQKIIFEVFDRLVEKSGENERSRNRSLITNIQAIVQQKYMQNITVQSIAKEVHFSPNYISSVFRNITGQKLNDYITNVRMEHASKLLEDTTLRIFEVAHAVGFENAQYFSTVFKKKMGRHPRSYRSEETE